MFLALLITVVYIAFVWLVFFRMKWLKFSIMWGLVTVFVGVHVLLIFLIGVRFITPYTTDATVVQHTIQLVPRLPEPTLVTAVLVEANTPVKKGQPLFQFDRRPYQYKVNAIQAQLAAAQQQVLELKANLDAATATVAQAIGERESLKATLVAATANVVDAKAKQDLRATAAKMANAIAVTDSGALSQIRVDQARQDLAEATAAVNVAIASEGEARVKYNELADATIKIAQANEEKARLAYKSEINGENTTVAQLKAELQEAQYYLDNTTLVAPEDGRIVNMQVQPGMVAGIFRIGGIATFIVDADRYLLGTYNQEVLKYVRVGQPVEVALDLYPGQIFKAKVQSIWRASGQGQFLPSGDLPKFSPQAPETPQGRFAVQITLDDPDQTKFPIGAQGAAAIYTSNGGFAVLRRIGIRGRTWMNWLYPLPF